MDNLFEYRIDSRELGITAESLAVAAGYAPASIPSFVLEVMAQALTLLEECGDIRAGFRILTQEKFAVSATGFSLGQVEFATGAQIAANLPGCTQLAVFTATAGEAIGRRITEANTARDYLVAYARDTLGSEIAERAGDIMQAHLEKKAAAQSLSITNRYSPGYCGWSVAEQQKLFSFLPVGFCGVTLTPSSLMLPLKSISGIIGLGAGVKKRDYGCAVCTLEHCYKRKRT